MSISPSASSWRSAVVSAGRRARRARAADAAGRDSPTAAPSRPRSRRRWPAAAARSGSGDELIERLLQEGACRGSRAAPDRRSGRDGPRPGEQLRPCCAAAPRPARCRRRTRAAPCPRALRGRRSGTVKSSVVGLPSGSTSRSSAASRRTDRTAGPAFFMAAKFSPLIQMRSTRRPALAGRLLGEHARDGLGRVGELDVLDLDAVAAGDPLADPGDVVVDALCRPRR